MHILTIAGFLLTQAANYSVTFTNNSNRPLAQIVIDYDMGDGVHRVFERQASIPNESTRQLQPWGIQVFRPFRAGEPPVEPVSVSLDLVTYADTGERVGPDANRPKLEKARENIRLFKKAQLYKPRPSYVTNGYCYGIGETIAPWNGSTASATANAFNFFGDIATGCIGQCSGVNRQGFSKQVSASDNIQWLCATPYFARSVSLLQDNYAASYASLSGLLGTVDGYNNQGCDGSIVSTGPFEALPNC